MEKYFNKWEPKTPLAWVAALRILLGMVFLTTWLSNLFKGFYTPNGLLDFFTNIYPQVNNPLSWYASFITHLILPIRSVFAPFQLAAEFLLAIGLLLGVFTPIFSLAGIFFLLNTFLATLGHDWIWSYWIPIGILVVTFFSKAGRAWGIDAYLVKRFGKKGWW
jgi:uncharacterized membrane protein YphA (DoxX/SURF4 family)